MINTVTKADGSVVPFNADKLNKWAHNADKYGVSWTELAQETYKRLEDGVSTEEIHQTMIKVCLSKESLQWSRVAARLEYATLRKNLKKHLGISDKEDSFETIFNTMVSSGYWVDMPEWNPEWNEWYQELYQNYFEYWQIKQWCDKYSLRINLDTPFETPHVGALGLALSLHGDTLRAKQLATAIVKGKINLPTPVVNGCRNGDFDTISCCVITGGDSVDSIGVAEHIAYKMTAKKAGIGIEYKTRSLGDAVKGGRVEHLGKVPIYAATDKAVKMFTQVTRGGSATVSYTCIDPEIQELILLKSQRTPENLRIDKMDYSFVFNDAFVKAVINNGTWSFYSYLESPEVYAAFYGTEEEWEAAVSKAKPKGSIKARDLLKLFLTTRGETGRIYCTNASRMNTHTPFVDPIYLSNLCQEIALPTKPYVDMNDLYGTIVSEGETAFCTLAAINVSKVEPWEYASIAELALRTVDILIDRAPMMTQSMEWNIRRRRSVGIGITGLAGALYANGMDYDGSQESKEFVSELAELHYFSLLKASQKLSKESGVEVEGVDLSWLPIDTMTNLLGREPKLPWGALRNIPRKHSVLVAHMPTESSAVFSDATNGLYPVRNRVIYKSSRKGQVQYIAPEGDYMSAYDVNNMDLIDYYSLVQDFSDQGISADTYATPSKHPGGKIPLSTLMKEFVYLWKRGLKTLYYVNTNDDNGGSFQDQAASDCCSV